jgi:hypothetical protein
VICVHDRGIGRAVNAVPAELRSTARSYFS